MAACRAIRCVARRCEVALSLSLDRVRHADARRRDRRSRCCSTGSGCRRRDLFDALVSAPLVLPPTVLGYYLLVALGTDSAIGRAWESLTGGDDRVHVHRRGDRGRGRLAAARRALGARRPRVRRAEPDRRGAHARRDRRCACSFTVCCRSPRRASSPARCSGSRARSATTASTHDVRGLDDRRHADRVDLRDGRARTRTARQRRAR